MNTKVLNVNAYTCVYDEILLHVHIKTFMGKENFQKILGNIKRQLYFKHIFATLIWVKIYTY